MLEPGFQTVYMWLSLPSPHHHESIRDAEPTSPRPKIRHVGPALSGKRSTRPPASTTSSIGPPRHDQVAHSPLLDTPMAHTHQGPSDADTRYSTYRRRRGCQGSPPAGHTHQHPKKSAKQRLQTTHRIQHVWQHQRLPSRPPKTSASCWRARGLAELSTWCGDGRGGGVGGRRGDESRWKAGGVEAFGESCADGGYRNRSLLTMTPGHLAQRAGDWGRQEVQCREP